MHKASGRCPQGLLRGLGPVRAVPQLSECPVTAALPGAGWGWSGGWVGVQSPLTDRPRGAGGLCWGLGSAGAEVGCGRYSAQAAASSDTDTGHGPSPTTQGKVKNKREMIAGEFKKLHTLLREEEQLLLQSLEQEERKTLQRLQENVTKLSRQSSSLQKLITEIEKKCQQPVAELLKDVKSTLSRSKNVKLQEPEVVSTDLKNMYKISLDMREALKRFGVDVTLDPDTAHPKLVLSEDLKRVRHGDTRQDLPNKPERFDPCVCVLGAEGFAGGRRYWEVGVGDKTEWDLGVCRESVSRKGKVTASPEDGFWAVRLRDGGYEALTSPRTPLPVSVRPGQVGIFLDYGAGEVSFYNVTDGSHLFTFTDTFSGTLRPYFSPCLNAGGTNVAPLIICPVPAPAGGNRCTQQ
ncbi:E3 ubiquitin-protein ligase TRIM39-like isoform X2 [Chelonia mydas]|uniref:E3 ubiquitin-protein ligase TRIM39-like isoform X2 n=1 Tax=Chelonia mydas TaxID=8469 RepID=UPI001CA95571|nr:E3 ubiquitin-protein ligase TRIM39-like isoform X2 [Chelonia mydas]